VCGRKLKANLMKLDQLEDGFSVSPQLQAEDFEAIAAAGYKVVINNRPDGEKHDYMPAAEAAELARSHGLEYHHIPVAPNQLTEAAIIKFKAVLDTLAGPAVAHCASGKRSSAMWAICKAGALEVDHILEQCGRAGHDLSGLRPMLVRSSV